MIPIIIFLLSIGLQLTAASFALLLIRTTGRKLAWILLSLAMVLMASRRIVSFVSLLSAGKKITFEVPELIALVISILMLAGVLRIGRYFSSIRSAEDKIRASEKEYRSLVDNALVGIYKTNLKGDILYINEALSKMFEFNTPHEMIKEGVLSRYEDLKDREVLIKNLKKNGKVTDFEVEVLTKTGKIKNILLSAVLDGDVISGMILDITERKQSEERLTQFLDEITRAKKEWEMTFDSVTELIAIVDKDFNIVRCNMSFAEFAEKPLEKIEGYKFYDLFPLGQKEIEYYTYMIKSEEPSGALEIRIKTGQWFYINKRPILDKNGKFIHSVITATNITELKDAQLRLIDSEIELKNRVEELEKFYQMAIGRELRMRELKEENPRLTAELSKYKKEVKIT